MVSLGFLFNSLNSVKNWKNCLFFHVELVNHTPWPLSHMRCTAPVLSDAFSSRAFPTHNRIVSPLFLIIIDVFVYLEHISYLIFHVTYFVFPVIGVRSVNMKQNIYLYR